MCRYTNRTQQYRFLMFCASSITILNHFTFAKGPLCVLFSFPNAHPLFEEERRTQIDVEK